MKIIKNFLLFVIIVAVSIGLFYFLLNFDFTGMMIDFVQDYYIRFGEFGVYASIFLISVFGNFTIILPVPYLLAMLSVIVILPINPLITGLFAGAGATIGETTAWLIGRGTRKVVVEKKKKTNLSRNIDGLNKLIEKGYAFPTIILFAMTPLPDDVLLITLGMAKYSLKKALLATFIGKILMTLVLSFLAVLSKASQLGQIILNLYGINIVDNAVVSSQTPLVSNITIILTLGLIFLFFIIDWTRLFEKKHKNKVFKNKTI